MAPPPLSVLLVEPDPRLRSRLATIVAELADVRLVNVVSDAAQASAALAVHRPKCLLLDLLLPPAELQRLISEARTLGTRVILSCVFDSGARLASGLHAGAEASICKDASAGEFARVLGVTSSISRVA